MRPGADADSSPRSQGGTVGGVDNDLTTTGQTADRLGPPTPVDGR